MKEKVKLKINRCPRIVRLASGYYRWRVATGYEMPIAGVG